MKTALLFGRLLLFILYFLFGFFAIFLNRKTSRLIVLITSQNIRRKNKISKSHFMLFRFCVFVLGCVMLYLCGLVLVFLLALDGF